MLFSLHIENVAVIKSVDLEFRSGFTALTGETGAGKSIIIDSINLILGAKADRELIRTGESSLTVGALFGELSENAEKILSECGVEADDDGNIYIQRTVKTDGKSVIRINGQAVSLSVLKLVAPALISIHGQNDTGSLLEPERHLELIDIFAANAKLLSDYRAVYSELEEVRREIKNISELEAQRELRREMLEYQIKDIESADLHAGEEEELVDKKVKLKNSEKILKNSEFAYKALKGSEKGSVSYLLDKTVNALSQISGVVNEFSDYAERLREISYEISEVSEEVLAVAEDLREGSDVTIDVIEERLDKISKLKRKYGLSVEEILAFRDRARAELDKLDNSEVLLSKLGKKEKLLYTSALELADKLHSERILAMKELEDGVKSALEFLDMPKVVFFAKNTECRDGELMALDKNGYDKIEFYISANRGAEPQSISKIASGGELARIMLALKGEISGKDGASTIIFDEIDSGVSGKTARKIGQKMASLSKCGQVFCVTHSAQIASLANSHFLIAKSDKNGKTETSVTPLDYDGRVNELSRILGGINVTDAQRDAAIDMLSGKDI